jgi:hypothetical protein
MFCCWRQFKRVGGSFTPLLKTNFLKRNRFDIGEMFENFGVGTLLKMSLAAFMKPGSLLVCHISSPEYFQLPLLISRARISTLFSAKLWRVPKGHPRIAQRFNAGMAARTI